jgi:hypothetical protein
MYMAVASPREPFDRLIAYTKIPPWVPLLYPCAVWKINEPEGSMARVRGSLFVAAPEVVKLIMPLD